MNILIRTARIKDAAAICQLNKEEMGYDFPLEDTEKRLRWLLNQNSDRIFVAVSGKKVVGYIHASDYALLYAPPMKNIMGIAVCKAWQNQGIGRQLLGAAEKWACETGATALRLVSGEGRTAAHRFYERCGFICGKSN